MSPFHLSQLKVINLFKIFLMYAYISLHMQFWVLLSLSTMLSKINAKRNKEMCPHSLVIINFDSFERKMMNNLSQLPQIFIGIWATACYNCGWLYPATGYECGCLESRRLDTSYGWLHPTVDSSSGGWIWLTRVPAAGYWLRLTPVLAAGYKLQLTTSYGWLESWPLDTTEDWFHPVTDYKLQLILFCSWLEPCQLGSTSGWPIK